MAEKPPLAKPTLQRPPGYRDPAAPPLKPPQPLRRPSQLPPSFRNAGKPCYRRRRRSCCCCLLFSLLASALLLSIAAVLSYLYYQPRLPTFTLQSLNATRLDVSSGGSLDAATSVKILSWNPNGKIAFVYKEAEGHVAASDADGDVDLGSASIAGFYQGMKALSAVGFGTEQKGEVVDDAVRVRLRSAYRKRDMRVRVEVSTGLGVRVKGKNTWKVPIKVVCGPVSLNMVRVAGQLPKCRVYLFRWFNVN